MPDIARKALGNLGRGVKHLGDVAVKLNDRRLKTQSSRWKKAKDVVFNKTKKLIDELAAVPYLMLGPIAFDKHVAFCCNNKNQHLRN